MWANPASPNLPDFDLFIQQVMEIPAAYLPISVPAPSAPTLSASTAGGSLPAGTVYVMLTYVTPYGETTASPEAAQVVTGSTSQVLVAAPAAAPIVTGYNVYAANASGAEVRQNAAPIAIGTSYPVLALAAGSAPPPAANAAGSPFPAFALAQALELTIPAIRGVGYTLATYNCAGHLLVQTTPDQPGRATEPGSFTEMRKRFGLLQMSAGLPTTASDQSTSVGLAVPDALRQLTLSDLQFMKTPWGREYIQWNQSFGDVFGLT
jgi:hypothetical protein